MKKIEWYHGGNFETGIPKQYIYVTTNANIAKHYAFYGGGKLYKLLHEYNNLLTKHLVKSTGLKEYEKNRIAAIIVRKSISVY